MNQSFRFPTKCPWPLFRKGEMTPPIAENWPYETIYSWNQILLTRAKMIYSLAFGKSTKTEPPKTFAEHAHGRFQWCKRIFPSFHLQILTRKRQEDRRQKEILLGFNGIFFGLFTSDLRVVGKWGML